MNGVTNYDKLSNVITRVDINEKIQSQLDRDIKSDKFANEVRELIALWKSEIEYLGYAEYIKSLFALSLEDHKLTGKRQGERSIVLNPTGGRLIYKYYKNRIIVKVIKITPNLDYD